MSLRWRIMGAIVFVVVLTVLASVGVGYYATQARLGVFVNEVGNERAKQLARNLSREYTDAGGWATVDTPLAEAGYAYEGSQRQQGSEAREGEHAEGGQHDLVRVVITDVDGLVVKDNLGQLAPNTTAPPLEGHRETVFDLTANRSVGHVYVDVNREFLSKRVARVPQCPPVHHSNRRRIDRRCCHRAGRLAVQTHHRPRDGPDDSNPGNRPG